MRYHPLPQNVKLSKSQFIAEMNKVLQSLPEYEAGMVVCFDESGYWLEVFGIKNNDNGDLLSIAHNLLLAT